MVMFFLWGELVKTEYNYHADSSSRAFGHKLVFQGFVHGDGGIQAGAAHYRGIQVFKAMLANVGRYFAAETAG
jgi:hypothetical protein